MHEGHGVHKSNQASTLGRVPPQTCISLIRQDHCGQLRDAFCTKLMRVPKPGQRRALVWMMAAGIDTALGRPVGAIVNRQLQDKSEPSFHIAGSDDTGIVWAVVEGARIEVDNEVVLYCAIWNESTPDGGEQCMQEASAFRKKCSEVLGSRQGPRIVLDRQVQSATATLLQVCDNAVMVVISAVTSGYDAGRRPALPLDVAPAIAGLPLFQHLAVPHTERHGGCRRNRPRAGPRVPVRYSGQRVSVAAPRHTPARQSGDSRQ